MYLLLLFRVNLLTQRFGERKRAPLGRAVIRERMKPRKRAHARNRDNVSAAGRSQHGRQKGAHRPEVGDEVDVDCAPNVRGRRVEDAAPEYNAVCASVFAGACVSVSVRECIKET